MKVVELFVDAYTMMEMLMNVNRVLPVLGRGRRITRKNFCPDHTHVAELHTATRYERGGWGLESLHGY